jgi:cytochrome c biogenesis protein CcdA
MAAEPEAPRRSELTSVGDVIDVVRDYAKQETVGPLRGAGRWLGFGVAAALAIGLGLVFVLLGLLRLIQTEWPETFDGAWAWVPHAVVGFIGLVLVAFALKRISRATLGKEPSQ